MNIKHFVYNRIDGLPRLAWCARLTAGSETVVVEHGPWVETPPGCFYAGAWSGALEEGRPDEAVVCCATGARIDPEGLSFFASSNIQDRLYLKRMADGYWLSNSLTFLLVRSGDAPAPHQYMYRQWFIVFAMKGIRRTMNSIPTRDGEVYCYECCNLRFDDELKFQWRHKTAPKAPTDYHGYLAMLKRYLKSVIDNASDPARLVSYTPVANLSKGYDGNFAAALGRDLGITEGVTFDEDQPGTPWPDDGSTVGEALGLNVHRFARRGFESSQKFPEAEFLVSPPGHQSPLGQMEQALSGRLNITGHYGDTILGMDSSQILPDLAKASASGAGGTSSWEYRLRIGCVEFPLFYTGWQHAARIQLISTSDAMRPWSVGGDYDRPIPRRTLEESGVSRELFGLRKMAGIMLLLQKREEFTSSSWRDIETFIDRYVEDFKVRAATDVAYLFHWGFWRTRERYDRALT